MTIILYKIKSAEYEDLYDCISTKAKFNENVSFYFLSVFAINICFL